MNYQITHCRNSGIPAEEVPGIRHDTTTFPNMFSPAEKVASQDATFECGLLYYKPANVNLKSVMSVPPIIIGRIQTRA